MEYPKIETLYNRDPKTFKVITSEVRLSEFENVKRWFVTEKVDGTNIRIMWDNVLKTVTFGGRTNRASIPTFLLSYLQLQFTPDKFSNFTGDAILFGEGYGEKIQKVGGDYRAGVSFRLFDVSVGSWWLEPKDIKSVADRMGCLTVPSLGFIDFLPASTQDLRNIDSGISVTAKEDGGNGLQPEGIIARSYPLMLTRGGQRIMWKLKYSDFE